MNQWGVLMSDQSREDTPDLVGPVMERLGYQRSSGLRSSSGVKLVMLTMVAACILASLSLIGLSLFSNQHSSVAQSAAGGDVISEAILRSRQDVNQIGNAIFRVQSPSQGPQDVVSEPVDAVLNESPEGTASNITVEDDIDGSVELEATFDSDGRYDDMAAREAGQPD